MNHIRHLKCLICGREYAPDEIDYVCPEHGHEGIVDVVYDYEMLRHHLNKTQLRESQDWSIWRYKALLPIAPDAAVPPWPSAGPRSTPRRAWPRRWVYSTCGLKTMAGSPPPPSKTGPAPLPW